MSTAFTIHTATTSDDFAGAKQLFIEYQNFLGVDLCFQSFEQELNILPEMYGPPTGRLLLAIVNNVPAGCVAVRGKTADVCEMKRLYVPEVFRGLGIGKALAIEIMTAARQLGYTSMVLDTLDTLKPAIGLYHSLGFKICPPYYANPLEGVVYMACDL